MSAHRVSYERNVSYWSKPSDYGCPFINLYVLGFTVKSTNRVKLNKTKSPNALLKYPAIANTVDLPVKFSDYSWSGFIFIFRIHISTKMFNLYVYCWVFLKAFNSRKKVDLCNRLQSYKLRATTLQNADIVTDMISTNFIIGTLLLILLELFYAEWKLILNYSHFSYIHY